MIYERVVRPLAFRLDAEVAHHLAFGALRGAMAVPPVRAVAERLLGPPPSARARVFGLEFPSRLGLAAGFDKDAIGVEALGALGFGFVEVGTVTLAPQDGNPRPRLFRLPDDRAIVNRMGFNNRGAHAMRARLERLPPRGTRRTPVGVNVGKNKATPDDAAAEEHAAVARLVGPFADYVVVNVSSPNTPGLRALQAREKLEPILAAVRAALDASAAPPRVPLLVKIAPDLDEAGVLEVCDLARSLRLDGLVATNTTISRDGLASTAERVAACGAGGLSGAPLARRALEVLELVRRRVGDDLTLIAAGGIETAADLRARLAAGASLAQIYTAFVYQGPLVARRLSRAAV